MAVSIQFAVIGVIKLVTSNFTEYPGAIISGSGGVYIVFPSEEKIEGTIKMKIRYKSLVKILISEIND